MSNNRQFDFIYNSSSKRWFVSDIQRATRPIDLENKVKRCPFCTNESGEEEVYTIGGEENKVRVVKNKYPFAPVHEIIIHSVDHHKNFAELSLAQIRFIIQAYIDRIKHHRSKDMHLYIFHNRGWGAGESLAHPHSQLVGVNDSVSFNTMPLDAVRNEFSLETDNFFITIPLVGEWPNEVWLHLKDARIPFENISSSLLEEYVFYFKWILHNLTSIYGEEFPFNFYCIPGENSYTRFIPRERILGGFEIGTGIYVNTNNQQATIDLFSEKFKKLR